MSETVTETVADRSIHEEVRDEEEDDEEEDLFCLWSAAAEDNSVQIKVIYSTLEERYVSDEEDKRGHTPLWVAAATGGCESVKVLAEFGADVNRPAARSGTTPIGIATQNADVPMILCLWQLKADINKGDSLGFTPVHIAAQDGNIDLLRLLVKLGGEIDTQNNCGATPLYLAAYQGDCDMIRELFSMGCEYIVAHDGMSPLWQAAILHHDEAVALMKSLGAPVHVPYDAA